MPPNLKVTLNICRGMSIQLRCREKRIAAEDSPHIRDLFHQKYRGSRYSFGYPACPNLEDQTKLFALLKPEENVGVRLTSGFLLEPEQSTSAIVVHHPGAKYFVV
jgi:5-methyltetrahydrofolate--homocysteine methyltransferase